MNGAEAAVPAIAATPAVVAAEAAAGEAAIASETAACGGGRRGDVVEGRCVGGVGRRRRSCVQFVQRRQRSAGAVEGGVIAERAALVGDGDEGGALRRSRGCAADDVPADGALVAEGVVDAVAGGG